MGLLRFERRLMGLESTLLPDYIITPKNGGSTENRTRTHTPTTYDAATTPYSQ